MRRSALSLLLVLMSSLARATAPSPSPSPALGIAPDLSGAAWESTGEDDGISVFRWSPPNSPLFAFRAIGTMEGSVAKVAQALIDIDRRKEWVPNLNEIRIVREVSPVERVEYMRVQTPFLIKNRDFVLDAHAEYDLPTRRLCFRFRSTEDPKVPESSDVRGKAYDSSYCLTSVDATHTKVEYQMLVDPMGSVSKWMVNLFQKAFPHNTIEALRRQAAKTDVTEHPIVRRLFATPGMTLDQALTLSKSDMR